MIAQFTTSMMPLTLELLGSLALLIVKHESLQLLLFDLVLHLSSASLYGERRLGRDSDLAGLPGLIVSKRADITEKWCSPVACYRAS